MKVLQIIAVCLLGGAAIAQNEEGKQVEVRISAIDSPGRVVIDRGFGSRLEVDDLVVLTPKQGLPIEGLVVEVEDRSAIVRLYDSSLNVAVGARGYVILPVERFTRENDRKNRNKVPDPSRYADDAWEEGMPLLAGIEAVDPAEREPLFVGRHYFSADQTFTTDQNRQDGFFRIGTDLSYENPFGRGGQLNLDVEYNYRGTHAPDLPGESFTRFRIDRASYVWGGDRFSEDRREVGRFLQRGMPEFGVIDGFEMGRRRENGDRYGFSFGFLPEPTPQFESGHDFQAAGFYEWHPLKHDSLVLTGGFQRSFHSRTTDRDLLIGKVSYRPAGNWDMHGTAWVDLYPSQRDDEKPLIELSNLLAVANRRYGKEGALTLTARHWTFPQINRFEFQAVQDPQLGDDRTERFSVSGWKRLSETSRFHGQVGAWLDEDEAGGDVEAGLEQRGLFHVRGRADLTGFLTAGEFSRVAGLRTAYDWRVGSGAWRLFYSIENQENIGFDVLDQLIQHWFRFSRDFYTESGWSMNFRGETLLFGDETSWSFGAYVQKSF